MSVRRIFLARHGQSESNRERRLAGQLDPVLSTVGEQQSLALADALSQVPLTAIFSSTLRRAIQTAEPTARAHRLPVMPQAGFMELHLGELEGRFRDERDPVAQAMWKQRKADPAAFRAPGGETFAELGARVKATLAGILGGDFGATILIVGHRETNRALLSGLLGWPEERVLQEKLRNHLVYEIDVAERAVLRTISLRAEDAGASFNGYRT